jgi:hypothetical protein
MSVHSDVLVLIYVFFFEDPELRLAATFWLHLFVDNISECILFIWFNSFVFRLHLINVKSYVDFVKPTHWNENLIYRIPVSLCSRSFSVCPRLVGHNKIRHVSHGVILSSLWVLERCQRRVTYAGSMTSGRIVGVNCIAVLVAEVI